jgi:hypothetical protein
VTDLIERHTILAVVVGSRAYGLDGPVTTAEACSPHPPVRAATSRKAS